MRNLEPNHSFQFPNASPKNATQPNDLSIPIPKTYRGFDPHGEVSVHTRNLPHWRQPGVTYFSTFRQTDSIPQEVWEEMQTEAKYWRQKLGADPANALPQLLTEYEQFQRRYLARQEKLLDTCQGSCRLKDAEARQLVADALEYFNDERYDLFGYVIMPNHCHVVVKPYDDRGFELETILQSWKSFTSRRLSNGAFWQADSFDRIVRDEDHYRRVIRYILNNPLKARLGEEKYSLFVYGLAMEEENEPENGSPGPF